MGGSKSAKGGPNPLADMDRRGPNPLADLDRGVQIRCDTGIMGAYFLLIFNTHISFQSCNCRSTIDIRRSPRQHFLK